MNYVSGIECPVSDNVNYSLFAMTLVSRYMVSTKYSKYFYNLDFVFLHVNNDQPLFESGCVYLVDTEQFEYCFQENFLG